MFASRFGIFFFPKLVVQGRSAVHFLLAMCLRFVLVVMVCAVMVDCITSQVQKDSLLDLYKATNGGNWANTFNKWQNSTDPCLVPWFGISCDTSKQNVLGITLNYLNLQGTLPNLLLPKLISMCGFAYLLDFLYLIQGREMTNNFLTGNVPELDFCTELESMWVLS